MKVDLQKKEENKYQKIIFLLPLNFEPKTFKIQDPK